MNEIKNKPNNFDDKKFEKQQLEFIISMYEMFFKMIFEFDNRDDLADYISEQISKYDKQLIDLLNS